MIYTVESRCQSVAGGVPSGMLISQDSRRIECPPTDPHYHVWTERWLVSFAQPPRFNTRQAATRAGMEAGTFAVKQCALPCPFTVKREGRGRWHDLIRKLEKRLSV